MDGAVRLLDGGVVQLGAETGLDVVQVLPAQGLLLGFFGLRQARGLLLCASSLMRAIFSFVMVYSCILSESVI